MPDFTDVADLIRWHLWWCGAVRRIKDTHLYFHGGDVMVDLMREYGRAWLTRMEKDRPGLCEVVKPAGVG